MAMSANDKMDKLFENNKKWAQERVQADPGYFQRLQALQEPEYLWIGCADSRVPANVIMGLEPGEVFVQRNVGNQACHSDMNVMACLEYAVNALKVKTIICCGHYGCGAVKGALQLPSKSSGLVNCWISDIRECRNQHHEQLRALHSPEEQVNRLCELNVMRQTFHVCTSPVVQAAWDAGQELAVYGVIYSLEDGLVHKLVGPLTKQNACLDVFEYEANLASLSKPTGTGSAAASSSSWAAAAAATFAAGLRAVGISPASSSAGPGHSHLDRLASMGIAEAVAAKASAGRAGGAPAITPIAEERAAAQSPAPAPARTPRVSEVHANVDENTIAVATQVAQHIGWAPPGDGAA